jgi:DNA polymerase III alpha subunit
VCIVGVVTDSFKRKSKKGNNYMRLEISDETGRIGAMLGDTPKEKKLEVWLRNNSLPPEDSIVIINGKKGKNDTIFIDKLTIMDEKIVIKKSELKE